MTPKGPCRQLAIPCKGVSRVASTRANHLAFLRHASKGLHPKTGGVFPLGTSLAAVSPDLPVGDTQQVPHGGVGSVAGGVESSGGQPLLPEELEDAPFHVCPTESDSIQALHEVALALRVAAPSAQADPTTDGSGSD